ncbi:MAG: hypothetical protein AABX11_03820 [Nanoarchaeota archaeon]
MVKKNVAMILLVIAVILVGVCIYTYFYGAEKISSDDLGASQEGSSGGGQVGIVILPPEVEDRGNGSG